MDKDKLVELAERCEAAAEGKQPGLLWEAGGLVHGTDEPTDSHSPHAWFVHYAQAEAWLDAAMTLVPEGRSDSPGEYWNVEQWTKQSAHAPHIMATAWVYGAPRVYAATPALALCAAALRSHAPK